MRPVDVCSAVFGEILSAVTAAKKSCVINSFRVMPVSGGVGAL